MATNLVFDMTSLLAPFCAGCLGFALFGLVALLVLAIGERRSPRAFRRAVDVGSTTALDT